MARIGACCVEGKYTFWFHLCRFLSSFPYFVWGEESKTWKSERVFWQIFMRGPNIAASRRVMERTSLEITQHLDADGGRAVITLLYGCGRIRKSLWWKTGKNVALHHLFRWTRQENHFFFCLNGLNAFLGSPSVSHSCFLLLNKLFLCLLLSSNSTGGAGLCSPLHLYRKCTTSCRSSPSWTDVGTAFVVERQHLHTPSAALPCSSEGVVEEEGGGKGFPVRRFGTNSHLLRRSHFFTVTSPGNWRVAIFSFGRNEFCAHLSPCKWTTNRFTGDINLICHLIFKVSRHLRLI